MRSNSAPLSSGSMAYFPEVKKELAATPVEGRKGHTSLSLGDVERMRLERNGIRVKKK